MKETTLGIIKPDAVRNGHVGDIISIIERSGLKLVAIQSGHMTIWGARDFYREHEGKPFFNDLTEFMSSGQSIALAIEGEDAVARWRALMGATDPAKAEPGTIRALYGNPLVIRENAVHGSADVDAAQRELNFFDPN